MMTNKLFKTVGGSNKAHIAAVVTAVAMYVGIPLSPGVAEAAAVLAAWVLTWMVPNVQG